MAFLALDSERMFMIEQKSELEFEEVVLSSNVQTVTQNLADLSAAGKDMESNEVKELQYYQQMYEQKQGSIESQLKVINASIESYNTAVNTNIKNDCKVSFSV